MTAAALEAWAAEIAAERAAMTPDELAQEARDLEDMAATGAEECERIMLSVRREIGRLYEIMVDIAGERTAYQVMQDGLGRRKIHERRGPKHKDAIYAKAAAEYDAAAWGKRAAVLTKYSDRLGISEDSVLRGVKRYRRSGPRWPW